MLGMHHTMDGCESCTNKGGWIQVKLHKMTKICMKQEQMKLFSQLHHNHHQKKENLFIYANVHVWDFILDYMHLVCLGVMKRILKLLKDGPAICRLSQVQQSMTSNDLIEMKHFVPSDFSWKPRSQIELDRRKASEFRQFLLYTGPIVLKKILSSAIYSHFLTFMMDVAIFTDSDNTERNTRI